MKMLPILILILVTSTLTTLSLKGCNQDKKQPHGVVIKKIHHEGYFYYSFIPMSDGTSIPITNWQSDTYTIEIDTRRVRSVSLDKEQFNIIQEGDYYGEQK